MTRPISLEIYDAFKQCDTQWMQRTVVVSVGDCSDL